MPKSAEEMRQYHRDYRAKKKAAALEGLVQPKNLRADQKTALGIAGRETVCSAVTRQLEAMERAKDCPGEVEAAIRLAHAIDEGQTNLAGLAKQLIEIIDKLRDGEANGGSKLAALRAGRSDSIRQGNPSDLHSTAEGADPFDF